MAYNRRIIFSSYVVPKETYTTTDLEETTEEGFKVGRADYPNKERIDSTVNKTLGGKGIVTDLDKDQWNDGWTSMFHQKVFWEMLTDNDDDTGNRWEDEYTTWSGVLLILAPTQLTPTLANVPMKFLYIKNVDDTYKAYVRAGVIPDSWNGTADDYNAVASAYDDDYKIQISPGASICLRGDGTDLDCDAVDVNTEDGPNGTKIEYIIAQ